MKRAEIATKLLLSGVFFLTRNLCSHLNNQKGHPNTIRILGVIKDYGAQNSHKWDISIIYSTNVTCKVAKCVTHVSGNCVSGGPHVDPTKGSSVMT